jgi:hypothetical protein
MTSQLHSCSPGELTTPHPAAYIYSSDSHHACTLFSVFGTYLRSHLRYSTVFLGAGRSSKPLLHSAPSVPPTVIPPPCLLSGLTMPASRSRQKRSHKPANWNYTLWDDAGLKVWCPCCVWFVRHHDTSCRVIKTFRTTTTTAVTTYTLSHPQGVWWAALAELFCTAAFVYLATG